MAYRSGYGAIEEAIKKNSSNDGNSTNYLYWKDKEKKVLRLLSDAPITIGVHEYVRCLDGKTRDFTCSKELANPRPCWICENVTRELDSGKVVAHTPRDLTMCLAALRESSRENGQYTVRDVLHDEPLTLEVDGEVKEYKGVPVIGLLRQGQGNFWSSFNGYYARYGTTLDRDYEITRVGASTDTKYTIIPEDKIDGMTTEAEVQEHYEAALLFHPSVEEYIERMGTEERVDYYLISGKSSEDKKNEGSRSTSSPSPSPAASSPKESSSSSGDDTTSFASLKEQLKLHNKK